MKPGILRAMRHSEPKIPTTTKLPEQSKRQLNDRRSMPKFDPRTHRLSPHFVLSDFLGCHSVYSKGYPNPFVLGGSSDLKLVNASVLCVAALEPLIAQFGGLSVAYGYISPELSEKIVK